ncbi:hypothetical protein BDQ12DRAFT_730480 [Crucibulum laeve]|uniref:Uncharacterized protein n=1 Tax=Crucibulum laeve TaxID=68775 RepID=A0A5C3MJ57_9AGAR|nr:hypothetical protein BDQ12DRAFT_730480 [Crucibulum laeve]
MTSTSSETINGREWEMGTYQRGLADNCFEEGQYDAAIAILEQLRSSTYKPSIPHIRQLLFIALHPSCGPSEDTKSKSNLESPSKLSKQRPFSSIPSMTVVASRRLLMSFITTNTPEALGRALPHYQDHIGSKPIADDESTDSIIAKQAMCIKEAKNCWNILEEGFTLRTKQNISSPNAKGKKRRDIIAGGDLMNEDRFTGDHTVVGDDAWPILDWIITLFECDERLAQEQGSSKQSRLLLQQMPPSRNGGPRWETSAPLDVIFHCLQQSNLRRYRMGSRLLTLLINLSSTLSLDPHMFIASLYRRLSASGFDGFALLMSSLPDTLNMHKFKITLCQKIISDAMTNDPPMTMNPRPKPQARAQPRAVRVPRDSQQIQHEEPNLNRPPDTIPLENKYPLPSSSDIIRLLGARMPSSSSPATRLILLRAKFELIFSYAFMQAQANRSGEVNSEWNRSRSNGSLRKLLEDTFGNIDEDSSTYHEVLLQSIF